VQQADQAAAHFVELVFLELDIAVFRACGSSPLTLQDALIVLEVGF
jgi:hypothetical protein